MPPEARGDTAGGLADDFADSLGLLERAVAHTRVALGHVRPELLGAPTPCAAWDLQLLLCHLADSLLTLQEAADPGRVDPVARRVAPPPFALPDLIRLRACSVLGAWSGHGASRQVLVAGSPMNASWVVGAGALEVAVHGWDVARSCGSTEPLPPRLAADLLDLAPTFVHAQDRPVRFGAPIPLRTVRAPAGDRLLAFLGRDS